MKTRFPDSVSAPDVHGFAPPTRNLPEDLPAGTEQRLRTAAAILARGAIRAALSQKRETPESAALGSPEPAQDNLAQ